MTRIGGGRPDWGSRTQIGGTLKELQDLKGNRDGIWDNESKPAGTPGDAFDRNPLGAAAQANLSVGLSTRDEIKELSAFVASVEKEWGQPVMDPQVQARLDGGELFAAQKAIALKRLGRDPSQVTDGFVHAAGSVGGRDIAPRELFFQKFAPIGDPSGKVVVVSPGFQETGRTFYEQIEAMNKAGHEVIVMDHQWAGQSDGSKGGIDSGFGVARDVAAMAAYAAKVAKETYGAEGEVVLFGNSMGAGPGVLGALALNDAGMVKLDGDPMPKGLKAVLQAPYLGATPSLLNDTLQHAARLPLLNRIKAPAAGLPDLTDDKVAEQKGAQGAVLEDVRAQLGAFEAVREDIETIRRLVQEQGLPTGALEIVHGKNDTLAHYEGSVMLDKALGDRAHLTTVNTSDHVLEQSPTQQGFALDALARLLER